MLTRACISASRLSKWRQRGCRQATCKADKDNWIACCVVGARRTPTKRRGIDSASLPPVFFFNLLPFPLLSFWYWLGRLTDNQRRPLFPARLPSCLSLRWPLRAKRVTAHPVLRRPGNTWGDILPFGKRFLLKYSYRVTVRVNPFIARETFHIPKNGRSSATCGSSAAGGFIAVLRLPVYKKKKVWFV